MTVQEAHILFDSLLREVNKEIELNIVPEQKDLFLNAASKLYIQEMATKERDRVRNLQTYANIGDYYTALAPFITELDLPLSDSGDRYSYCDLPTPSNSLAMRGLFLNNQVYAVVNEAAGFDVSNLSSDISSDEPIYVGYTYSISMSDIVVNSSTSSGGSNPTDKNASTQARILKGNMYKIVRCSGFDCRQVGSVSNAAGTIFTATATRAIPIQSIDLRLEVYAAKANDLGSPRLEISPITSNDYAEAILFSALVGIRPPIRAGSLVKGKKYFIVREGNTDLEPFGAVSSVINTSFVCTVSGEPNWTSAPTTIQEAEYRGGELIKPVDLEDRLVHAFGSTVSRPVVTIVNNQARVYHMGNFKPTKLLFTYIRIPNKINYKVGGSLEFNGIEELDIVQKAVRLAASSINSENYPSLRAETSESSTKQ